MLFSDQKICSVVTFVYVFIKVLNWKNEYSNFYINVTIVRNFPTIV